MSDSKVETGPGVVMYTTDFCPYCTRAKSLLSQRGIPFKEIKMSYDDDDLWAALFDLSEMRTAPQIFANGKLVGGYTELAELDRKDRLASLK